MSCYVTLLLEKVIYFIINNAVVQIIFEENYVMNLNRHIKLIKK